MVLNSNTKIKMKKKTLQTNYFNYKRLVQSKIKIDVNWGLIGAWFHT